MKEALAWYDDYPEGSLEWQEAIIDAHNDAIVTLREHRDKRPVLLELSDPLTYIANVVDWRIEMEAIVDGILEKAGY